MNSTIFIPNTNIQWAWDATSLSAFKKCPRYYKLAIIDNIGNDKNIHLRWGGELHKALEDYDRTIADGINHDDAVHDTIRALLARIWDWEPIPTSKSEELKTKPHLVRTVVWYLEHYRQDPAKTYVLKTGAPAVELNFNFPLDFEEIRGPDGFSYHYHLCGYLDRVVEYSGDLYVIDRKTSSYTINSNFFDKFDLDEQMTLYNLASQVLLNTPIKGVMIDGIQIAVGFSRFVRSLTYRTPDQLEEWLQDLRPWLAQAEAYATADHWPMNFTSCDKYGGCAFKRVCERSPAVREKMIADLPRRETPWNPLEPR